MGVGMLSVPYTVYAGGILPALFYFLILGAITLFINLAYGELILRTNGKHRLVGYIRQYLGEKYAKISTLTSTLGIWGALIAYILVGGKFLELMFARWGGEPLIYQTIFFITFSWFITRGVKMMAEMEFILTGLLVALLVGFLMVYTRFIDVTSFSLVNWREAFLPYGVILFAIGGSAAVPEMRDILGKQNEHQLKSAIIWGTLISLSLIAIWGLVVAGITGQFTTDEAIVGLSDLFGPVVGYIGGIFGFLLVATSFLVLGENLFAQFRYDLGVRQKLGAWSLALLVPFIILLVFRPSLLLTISITGAIFGAVDLVFLILAYFKSRERTAPQPWLYIKHGVLWGVISIIIFKLGAIYEIYYTFFGR